MPLTTRVSHATSIVDDLENGISCHSDNKIDIYRGRKVYSLININEMTVFFHGGEAGRWEIDRISATIKPHKHPRITRVFAETDEDRM